MLIPFVIDVDGLKSDPGEEVFQTRAAHERVIDMWLQRGLLIVDEREDGESELLEVIERLPQKLRNYWLEAWKNSLHLSVKGWDGVVTRDRLERLCAIDADGTHQLRLAVVDDVRALEDFDLDEEELETAVCIGEGTEITVSRMSSVDRSRPIRELEELASRDVERGESWKKIWEERFEILIEAPGLVYVNVVDRYALAGLWSAPQSRLSGLERFLKLVKDSAKEKRYVKIFSAITRDMGPLALSEIEDELRKRCSYLSGGRLKKIDFYLLSDGEFGNISHDRFVRFGGKAGAGYVWDLGCGLEIFEAETAYRRSHARFEGRRHACCRRETEEEVKKTKGIWHISV